MTQEEIKKGIIELWSKYYKGPKSYLEILADNYYHDDMMAIHIIEGKVVASIMGIPYQFGHDIFSLKGLFLWGVVTEEKYRHQGIMCNLLSEINIKAKESDFDFTFLIPTSDLNADFFRRRGYFNSFYLLEERYTSVHNFRNDFEYSLLYSDERIKNLKTKLYDSIKVKNHDDFEGISEEDIIKFIQLQENKISSHVGLKHSDKDLFLMIKKCQLNDDRIFIAFDEDKELRGVAYVEKKEMKRICINALFVEDSCTYYSLLDYIKSYYSDYSMSVFSHSGKNSAQSLMETAYGAINPNGGDLDTLFGLLETQVDISKLLEPTGLVRFLKFESVFQYIASNRKEAAFKLYVREPEYDSNKKHTILEIRNGQLYKEVIERKELDNDRNILKLSIKEVSEILLRKKDASSLIMEAFGIPRLTLEMNLMPR